MKPVLLITILLVVTQSCRKHEDRCRLIRTENDRETVSYIYNDDDQLTTMQIEPTSDSAIVAEWQYFYNSKGQMDSMSQRHLTDNSYPSVFAYRYDDNGQMAHIVRYSPSAFAPGSSLRYVVYNVIYENSEMAGYLVENYDGSKSGKVLSDYKGGSFHKALTINRDPEGNDEVVREVRVEYDDYVNPLRSQIPLWGLPQIHEDSQNNVVSYTHTIGMRKLTFEYKFEYKRKLPCKRTYVSEDGEKEVTEYFYEFY